MADRQLLRYRRTQRLIHALLASSFTLLFLTGIFIVWSPASGLAAGGWSRWLHRVAAIGFMAVPVLYLVRDRAGAKELLVDSFRFDRDDVRWLRHIYRYATGHAKDMPPQGRLNAGQKLHHAAVIVLCGVMVVTGLMLWLLKPGLGATGLAWVALIHDLGMLALILLLIGHLFFTFTYKALSGMTTGYVPETEARLEHVKWVEEMEAKAPAEVGAAADEPTRGETPES